MTLAMVGMFITGICLGFSFYPLAETWLDRWYDRHDGGAG